jgi:hypothetical protein
LRRYQAVTAEQVQEAAKEWLGEERVVLHVVPDNAR